MNPLHTPIESNITSLNNKTKRLHTQYSFYSNLIMSDSTASTPDVHHQRGSLALFMTWNILWSLLGFPVCCLLSTALFFNNDFGLTICMAVISVLHLIVLWIGLLLLGKARVFAIPFATFLAFMFLQTRHIEVEFDTGPFSTRDLSGGQQVWGLTSYYRVFDKPRDSGATTDFDWSALIAGVEYAVLLTLLFGLCVLIVTRWSRADAGSVRHVA